MKTKLLTRINALIVLMLSALGIGGCNNAPQGKYGPPQDRKQRPTYQSDDIEELYGIPVPPGEDPEEEAE